MTPPRNASSTSPPPTPCASASAGASHPTSSSRSWPSTPTSTTRSCASIPSPAAARCSSTASFVEKLDDIEPDEGPALLARLLATVSQPTYQVRFRWRTDSFAMWDNRSTQHCAAQDFGTARRRVERVDAAR